MSLMSPICPMRFFKSLLLLILFLLPLSAMAGGDGKAPKMQKVAMFGVGISFTDSVVYETEIQVLDSVWLSRDRGFLEDRTLYSLQLQYYMERQGVKNAVCTVLFNKSQSSLKSKWEKIRKRHTQSESQRFKIVPLSEFRFQPEEYRPVIIHEDEE